MKDAHLKIESVLLKLPRAQTDNISRVLQVVLIDGSLLSQWLLRIQAFKTQCPVCTLFLVDVLHTPRNYERRSQVPLQACFKYLIVQRY